MKLPKDWTNFFFRIGFASVLIVVPAMFLLSAAERGHVNAALAPWLKVLIRVLAPLGAYAVLAAGVTIVIKRLRQ